MPKKQIILYELNEVPELIIHRYSQKSIRFHRLLKNFSFYQTKSYDETNLHPWITWSTVHRGVNFQEHQISNLGQDVSKQNIKFPPIWMNLLKKGLKVGVYGSMHSNALPKNFSDYDFYIPDVFSNHSNCHPNFLKPIQDFQLKLTRGSARNIKKSFLKDLSIAFLIAILKSGIKLKTFLSLFKQILHEQIDKEKINRRRTFQSVINFDIYMKLLTEKSPNFSSFFSNHVASAMHRYWEAAYPKDFNNKNKQNKVWRKKYKNEINFAMQIFEEQLFELLKYASKKDNCEIWICTSMGQAPDLNYEPIHSHLYLTNPSKLLDFLNFDRNSFKIMPAMMPKVCFTSSKENIKRLSYKIKNLTINNRPCKQIVNENSITLVIGCHNKIPEVRYQNNIVKINNLGLEIVKVKDQSGSSGVHIPEGVLLINGKNSERFRNLEVIPTNKIKKLLCSSF